MGRHFKRALANLHFNSRQTVWNTLTMTAAMLLLGIAILSFVNVNLLTTKWNTISEITLYLDDDFTVAEQTLVANLLSELPAIKGGKRIDPAATMHQFSLLSNETAQLVKGLDPNIFPPAILLTLDTTRISPKTFPQLLSTLQTVPGMVFIDYGQYEHEEVGSIAIIIRSMVTICAILVAILMLFVVFNTIKVAIYNRRNELDIQWLVGATLSFIRAPLLWEGFIQGTLAGAFATLLLLFGEIWLAKPINDLIQTVIPSLYLLFYDPILWPLLMGIGAFMATLGTMLGVRRIIV